ncbi:MAG: hypothetical protein L6R42_005562, partial [Xanthoria sp. 1 TBL-2021]
ESMMPSESLLNFELLNIGLRSWWRANGSIFAAKIDFWPKVDSEAAKSLATSMRAAIPSTAGTAIRCLE